jgi:hypothetical protein
MPSQELGMWPLENQWRESLAHFFKKRIAKTANRILPGIEVVRPFQPMKRLRSDSIGGVLQRLELSIDNRNVIAGFTRDDRNYMDGSSYSVTPETCWVRFRSSRRWDAICAGGTQQPRLGRRLI